MIRVYYAFGVNVTRDFSSEHLFKYGVERVLRELEFFVADEYLIKETNRDASLSVRVVHFEELIESELLDVELRKEHGAREIGVPYAPC